MTLGVRLKWIEGVLSEEILTAQSYVDAHSGSALLYKITSPSELSYIGVSQNIVQRLWCHPLRSLHIGNSIRKHGLSAHKIEVLAVLPMEAAYELEARAIVAFETLSPKGMNLDYGGKGFRPLSEESAAKKRRALQRPKSEAHKQALSIAHTGKKRSAESCRKQSIRLLGKRASAEVCVKISIGRRGWKPSAETIFKMRIAAKGRGAGRKQSLEERAMRSVAAKARWARQKAEHVG